MRPHSERLFLQEVSGSFKMAGKEERRSQARLRAEQYVNPPGGDSGDAEAPVGAKRPTGRDELDRLDFDADEVEVAFNGLEEKGGTRTPCPILLLEAIILAGLFCGARAGGAMRSQAKPS